MAVHFEKYTPAHVEAVRAFNRRVGTVLEPELLFPEQAGDPWLAEGSSEIYHEGFVAIEGSEVRGGYYLKHQPFSILGEIHQVSSYRLPVSEGVANRAYAALGFQMLRDALARQPLLFSLGMGSLDRPLARLQKAAGWSQYVVPFLFRVIHGGSFLRNIALLRSTPARRAVLDVAAYTGAGSLAFAALRQARRLKVPAGITVQPFREFGPWADDLWQRCHRRYSLIAVRDSRMANILYPPNSGRFLCWKVSNRERLLGWAVGLDTRMQAHKQFGDMRVATIVDGVADPADAGIVIAAAARELERRGVDLIITNQMHLDWAPAGFMEGPSNYIFSASKKLSELLAPFETNVKRGHINRGDGDGPIHL